MAAIVETLLSDRRLQLGCEEYRRTLSFGSNWTKIRLAARLACNYTGSVLIPHGGPYFGVAQGTGGLMSTAIDYVGATQNNGGSATSFYNVNTSAGGIQYYAQPNNGIAIFRKIGNSTTVTRVNSANHYFPCQARSYLGQMMMEFTKVSSTSITVAMWTPSTTSVIVGVNRESFLNNIEMATPTNCENSTSTSFTITSSMLWDTACLAWMKSTPTLEVADFAVVRFT